MHIEALECKNFRNYRQLAIHFDRGMNILVGDNAQGKTNLLEAIHLCGTARSHKLARDNEMIGFGEEEAHLRLLARKNGAARRIDMHLRRGKAKGIAVDGVPIHKASELMGTVYTVLFSPEDLAIVKRGPKERRRFLDSELCQLSRLYFAELSDYNKVIVQRNALLKDFSRRSTLAATLEVWDEQLIRHALPIIRARRAFVEELIEISAELHTRLTGGREELELRYEPDVAEEELAAAVEKNRDRDLHLRTTTTGPHRDDINVVVNGIDIRRFGSQGQQRQAALSLKLAEIELVRRRVNDTPILLLDDVLSELDATRQTMLLENMADIQTVLTCTGVEDLLRGNFPGARKFRVKSGEITDA